MSAGIKSVSDPSLPGKPVDMTEINYFNLPFDFPTPPFISVSISTPTVESNPIDNSFRTMKNGIFNASSTNTTPLQIGDSAGASSSFGVDPPRPPRDGFDSRFWRWRTRSNKSASDPDGRDPSFASPTTTACSAPYPLQSVFEVQNQAPCSPYVSESAHVFSLQHPSGTSLADQTQDQRSSSPGADSAKTARCPLSTPEEKISVVMTTATAANIPCPTSENLYIRAKKGIGAKFGLKGCNCPTIPENEHVHSTADQPCHHQGLHTAPKAGSWLKEEIGKPKLKRKLFGRAPWHRKESGDSFSSVTSSVREVLRGETPPSTPLSAYSPLQSWGNQSTTQFPGGEAVRVKTPPLREGTADGKPRGFFTSMTPPVDNYLATASSTSLSKNSSRQISSRLSVAPGGREWWEQTPKRQIRHEAFDHATAFDFQIPEHLPTSPICPANEKHPSGGTALCVYHGRRRAASALRDSAPKD